ncbi:MAG: cyclic nucleotide-binding domain-containing protein [Beijerinckiaceae bacterium]
MRQQDIEEMRHLPLFEGIDPARVTAMLKASFLQRFPPHVELAREGDPADFMHVVVEGQVEVFSAYRQRETTVSVVGPGGCFIIAAVLLDRVYLKSARALTGARILLIPAELVRQAFAEDAAFARVISAELALAYRAVVKELKNQKLRSSLERLANWLIAADRASGGSGCIELPFDKKVLASRLGMAPEVLSRSFAALQPYDVVVNGPEIRLKDMKALASLAHPSPTIDDPMI